MKDGEIATLPLVARIGQASTLAQFFNRTNRLQALVVGHFETCEAMLDRNRDSSLRSE